MCWPSRGIPGALNVRATAITPSMNLAAADAIASVVNDDQLAPDHIIPSPFDPRVAVAVASAVSRAACAAGVARNRSSSRSMFAVYAQYADAQHPFRALRVGERPDPDVGSSHGRVGELVEVRAASVNHHDLWTLRGVGIAADSSHDPGVRCGRGGCCWQ